MEERKREEILQKVSDILDDAMRLSSKIFAVDALFNVNDGEISISADESLEVHVVLDEVGRQIGESLSNAIDLVNKLQGEVTA